MLPFLITEVNEWMGFYFVFMTQIHLIIAIIFLCSPVRLYVSICISKVMLLFDRKLFVTIWPTSFFKIQAFSLIKLIWRNNLLKNPDPAEVTYLHWKVPWELLTLLRKRKPNWTRFFNFSYSKTLQIMTFYLTGTLFTMTGLSQTQQNWGCSLQCMIPLHSSSKSPS